MTTVSAPGSAGVEQVIERYSRQYGVDPSLMKGLAWQESGWKQHVVSSSGAIGVMQVLPQTGEFIAEHLLKEPVNLNDREQNIKAGVRFFAFYLSKTNGDEATAVAGYFQGLRSVWQNGISEATKKYVASVLALRHRFPTLPPNEPKTAELGEGEANGDRTDAALDGIEVDCHQQGVPLE